MNEKPGPKARLFYFLRLVAREYDVVMGAVMNDLKPFDKHDYPFSIRGRLNLAGPNHLEAVFEVHRAIEQIRWPKRSPEPTRRDELWKTTCFEIFFGAAGDSAYSEVNLSPSGDWALYSFDSYRHGMRNESRFIVSPPEFTRTETHATLRSVIDLRPESASPICFDPSFFEASLTAVIETNDGRISYWAVKHAGLKPDFHDRGSLIVRL